MKKLESLKPKKINFDEKDDEVIEYQQFDSNTLDVN